MKNIFKHIKSGAILIALLHIVSCQDAIDIEQPGRLLAENTFRNISDLEGGLYGVYSGLDYSDEIRISSVFCDEAARGVGSGGQGRDLLNHTLVSDSEDPEDIWNRKYLNIASINRVLAAAENIERADDPNTDNVDEAVLYDSIIGQLHAIRAYLHFSLLTYFTTDYTDDNALGVILLDFVAEIGETRTRSTNGEIYTFINADLDKAVPLISTTSNNPIFVSQDFIKALRARMALYREQYALANTLATELLNDYPIANRTQYFNMYLDNDNTEVIWKLDRTISDGWNGGGRSGGGRIGELFNFSNTTTAGAPFLEMGRDVFNQLDVNDVRYSVNVDPTAVIDPDYSNSTNFFNSDILPIRKYPGSEGQDLMNDLKIFRSSEMLFIKAEALAATNDLAGAATLIHQLRIARYDPNGPDIPTLPVYTSQEEAFGDIMDERRIELVFEGHRWVDLKRLGARANRVMVRDAKDCELTNACSLSSTDHRYTLPIPLSEINVNSAIGAQQNPGY